MEVTRASTSREHIGSDRQRRELLSKVKIYEARGAINSVAGFFGASTELC